MHQPIQNKYVYYQMAIALKKRVKHRKEKAKSSNTLRAYKGDWLKFLDYCQNSEDLAKNDDNIHPNNYRGPKYFGLKMGRYIQN